MIRLLFVLLVSGLFRPLSSLTVRSAEIVISFSLLYSSHLPHPAFNPFPFIPTSSLCPLVLVLLTHVSAQLPLTIRKATANMSVSRHQVLGAYRNLLKAQKQTFKGTFFCFFYCTPTRQDTCAIKGTHLNETSRTDPIGCSSPLIIGDWATLAGTLSRPSPSYRT